MHGYARWNSVAGLASDTACRAAGQIGESGPPRSTDVRKGSGYGTTKWESARRSRAQMALLAHGAPGEEGFTIRLGCGWLSPLRGLGRPISRGS